MKPLPSLAALAYEAKYRRPAFRAALLLYAAVLVFGSIPGARADVGELAGGLVLHGVTYGVISLLLYLGAGGRPLRKACVSFAIVAAMGALDEYLQSFFPYRTAAILDWYVDIGASLITLALMWAFWPTPDQHSR